MNYIAFLDLLGIKSIASLNNELYFNNIKKFQQATEICSNAFIKSKYQIRVFSDCAYIECENITDLFKYLQNLRHTLFLDEIFFNAAVTTGTLRCSTTKKNEELICINFESKDTVKVYSMQTTFFGIGIYVDPNLAEILDETTKTFCIASSYCSNYNNENIYNNFNNYFDIKYKEITINLIKYILMNYIKTISLNKKAAALRKILCKKKSNQTSPVDRADREILLLIALFPEWERGMRASA
jgi:hypothetical protein